MYFFHIDVKTFPLKLCLFYMIFQNFINAIKNDHGIHISKDKPATQTILIIQNHK